MLVEKLFNEVFQAKQKAMDAKRDVTFEVYLDYDLRHKMLNELPRGYSPFYELLDSQSVCGVPVFSIVDGFPQRSEGQVAWRIVEIPNKPALEIGGPNASAI